MSPQVLSLLLLIPCLAVAGDPRGGEADQQAPQLPVPLVRGAAPPIPAFEGNGDPGNLCPHDPCPDKVQVFLAGHPGVRGRLLASELSPEHRLLAPGWGRAAALTAVPRALLRASHARLDGWLKGRDARLAEIDRQDRERDSTGVHAGPRPSSRSVLQDWKRVDVYHPRISSGPYWDQLDWGRWPVTGAWSRTFTVAAGDRVEVGFSRLRPALGYLAPDPVAWLLDVDGGGDPARGSVRAWSDDVDGGPLPRLAWTAADPGTLRLLVAAYQPSSAGFTSLVVQVNGQILWEEPGIFFGGVRIPQVEVAAGDVLHVVAGGPEGDPAGADAVLFLLSDGFEDGATWQAANNNLGLSPSLTVGIPGAIDATILLSAFGRTPLEDPLLLLSRGGSGAVPDRDGDGLDGIIEGILGTCDGPPEEASCVSPVAHLDGWDSRDSDMDGPTDLEELVGVRRCYRRAPGPPFGDPGRCRDDDQDGRCDATCQPGDTVIEQPLGPAMGADPRRYDVWVEMDGRAALEGEDGVYRVCLPAGDARTQLRALYDPPLSAGRRRPADGQGITVHWFNDEVLPVGFQAHRPRLPSQAERRAWFNTMFTSARKYSGVFRYMVGTCGNAGQSDGRGRVGIVGADGSPAGGMRVAHELGHLLALSHYWDRPLPDRTPFYLSLMNYGYMYRVPPMVDWDGEFASCGPGRSPCRDGFTCVEAAKAWRCVPDCGRRSNKEAQRPWGFSAGALRVTGAPRELDVLPEEGYPRWYLPWLYCYTDERQRISHTERLQRFLSPICSKGRCVRCEGDICAIDWDRDGDFDGAEQFDVDYSATVDDALLVDRDDFRRMLEEGWKGLHRMTFGDVVLLADGFEPGVRTGIAPAGPAAPAPDGGLWRDVTNVCDEAGRWTMCNNRRGNHAALFRGPASGDRGLRYAFCDLADAVCSKGYRSAGGATLSLRVKVWSPTWEGEGATLAWLDGYRLQARVAEDGRDVRWRLLGPGVDGTIISVRDRGAAGQWTRLTIQLDDRKDQVRLIVRRGDLVIDETTAHAPATDLDLSQLWIGAPPGEVTSLTGLIDDVVLISWPVKY
ncbi:MAG: hypothetical protein ABIK09_02525 [Pseudomonadota bacterium]